MIAPRTVLSNPLLRAMACSLLIAGCSRPASPPDPGKAKAGKGTEAPESVHAIVQEEPWGEVEGREVVQYFLSNKHGMRVTLTNLGAAVTSVDVPDRNGKSANVTLSYPSAEDYAKNAAYFGCICGRYANRIAKGKFKIGEEEYTLATNNGENHLHGGVDAFHRRIWESQKLPPQDGIAAVRFSYESPDGEEGYPGKLKAVVTYTLTDDNELKIEYTAQTDKPTPVNLTNHAYWNLAGAGSGTIDSQELTLFCDEYLPVDETLIPTGERKSVEGTPLDFRQPKAIGARYEEVGGGYDHCYVINGEPKRLTLAAKAVDPKSGRVMEVLTTEPGIQLYTGNFLDGSAESGGFPKHGAFCLECQHFPDSPNQPEFPSTILKPGEVYTQTSIYRFSTQK